MEEGVTVKYVRRWDIRTMLHRAEFGGCFSFALTGWWRKRLGPKGGRKVVGVVEFSGGVDKRTAEEKGIAPIPSRYVGITRFLYH